jgi:hypothetical protein
VLQGSIFLIVHPLTNYVVASLQNLPDRIASLVPASVHPVPPIAFDHTVYDLVQFGNANGLQRFLERLKTTIPPEASTREAGHVGVDAGFVAGCGADVAGFDRTVAAPV